MKTYSPKVSTIARKWHLFDARNQVLGRLSTQIAKILMGKDRTDFSRHLDMGDHVVIINAAEIVVTGRKEKPTRGPKLFRPTARSRSARTPNSIWKTGLKSSRS